MGFMAALLIWFVIVVLIVFGVAIFKATLLYTVRFVSAAVFFALIGTTVILWLGFRENWVLIMGIAFALLGYCSILSWPKTQPRLMKKLKLR